MVYKRNVNILFLGGNRFFGKALLKNLSSSKVKIYLINRGNKKNISNKNIHFIKSDRNDFNKLSKSLDGIYFDVVLDNIAYKKNSVAKLLKILKNNFSLYILTSSVMTYFDKSLKTKDDVVYEMKLRFDIKDDIDLSNSLKIKIIRDIYRLCVLHIDKFKDDYGFIKAINKSRICVSDELNYIDNIYNDFELKNLNFWLSKIHKYYSNSIAMLIMLLLPFSSATTTTTRHFTTMFFYSSFLHKYYFFA